MSNVPRKKRMEKNKENNAFFVIKGIGSDRPSVPTLVGTVEGGATTSVPNASFNIFGSVNKRREKEAKKEEEEIKIRFNS